jgi:MFS family permease
MGRLATGWLLDRFFAPYVSSGLLAIACAGITLLSQAHSASSGFVAAALIGVGMGGEGDITPYLLSRYFNLKSFSTLNGITWSAYAVAGAVGPVIMGRAFDHSGSYDRLLMKLSVLTLGTALLSLALPRYRESATTEVVQDLEVQVMDRV